MASAGNPTASRTLDPFAGGQMQMDAVLFKQAVDVLDTPSGDPARAGLSDVVFAATMVVKLRQDALSSVATHSAPPAEFVCPTCIRPMIEDVMNQSVLCTWCGRGISYSMLHRLFLQSAAVIPGYAQQPVAKPKPATINLTGSLTKGVEPDPELLKAADVETKEPMVMWRSWRISLEDDHPYLASSNHKMPWPAKEPLTATHAGNRRTDDNHETPNWHCGCGIYAVKTLVQAQAWSRPVDGWEQAVGRVALWGRVHLYSEGARAQFGYPKEIWIPSGEHAEAAKARYEKTGWTAQRLADTLAADYGIEVHVDDGMFNLGLSDG